MRNRRKRTRSRAGRSAKRRRLFYTRRRRRGTRPRTTRRFIKNIALQLSEAKRVDKNYPIGGVHTFAHDGLYECLLNTTDQSNTTVITALVNSGQSGARVGDEIYSTGFMLRGAFGVPYDRRNAQIKMWLVEYNSNQGTPTSQAQWFHNVTGNNMLDPINNDRWPGVKLLRTFRCKPKDLIYEEGDLYDAGSINTIYYKIWVPWKRHLRYTSSSSVPPVSGCKERLSIIFTAYDTKSSLTTDTIVVDHDQSCTFYFKDP